MNSYSGLLLAALLGAFIGALVVFLVRQTRIAALLRAQQQLQADAQSRAVEAARDQARQQQLEQELRDLTVLKTLPAELAAAQARLSAQQEQEQHAAIRQQQSDDERRRLEMQVRERDTRLVELETRLLAEREQLDARMAFIKEQEQTLRLQFEQLATRIFEEITKIYRTESYRARYTTFPAT